MCTALVDYVLLSDDNATSNDAPLLQTATATSAVNNQSTTSASRLVYTEHDLWPPRGHEAMRPFCLHRTRGWIVAVRRIRRLTTARHRPVRQPTTNHQPTNTQPLTDTESSAWFAADVLCDRVVDRPATADSRRRRSTTTLCSSGCCSRSCRSCRSLLLRCVVVIVVVVVVVVVVAGHYYYAV